MKNDRRNLYTALNVVSETSKKKKKYSPDLFVQHLKAFWKEKKSTLKPKISESTKQSDQNSAFKNTHAATGTLSASVR